MAFPMPPNRPALRRAATRFIHDEAGFTATYFSVLILCLMLMVTGIAVDLMKNEMTRTRVQNTLDRAVLAAADLDQTLDPTQVVNDYFDKAGLGQFLTSVNVEEGLNFRTVTAHAEAYTTPRFLSQFGMDQLSAPARSTAEEKIANVEISMVLDISGSMSRSGRMTAMRNAANVFIDTVLTPSNKDLVSVNLVPYTSQVSAGERIFNAMNMTRLSGNPGWCVDFEASDFNATTLRMDGSYAHMQFFDAGWGNSYPYHLPVTNAGCPGRDDGNTDPRNRSYEQIIAFNQNAAYLKSQVNQYQARANTAIHIGMKWGVAMLDPTFRTVVQALDQQNVVDDAFAARPAAYDDIETLKTIVLLTDGNNVDTVRIADWAYDRYSYRVHWTKYPLHWYLDNYVRYNWNGWRYTKYSAAQADSMLGTICQAARDKGVVIWSIGFEVNDAGANVMQDCASSPSHFFRVEGVEIEEAFSAIAKQINQLRLTQ